MQAHIGDLLDQIGKAPGLTHPLSILRYYKGIDVPEKDRFVIADLHQLIQHSGADADAIRPVEGHFTGFGVNFKQAAVFPAQGVGNRHLFPEGGVDCLDLSLLGKLPLLLLVHILKADDKFIPFPAGLHQLTLEVAYLIAAEYTIIKIIRFFC